MILTKSSGRIFNFPRAAAYAAALAVCTAAPAFGQQPERVPPVPIGRIEVVGIDRLPENQVLSVTGIQPGDSIRALDVERAVNRLWRTREFDDVIVRSIPDPNDPTAPITLRIELVERPLLGSVQFFGLENIRPAIIRDTVGLRAGRPFGEAQIAQAESMIRTLLGEKGYRVRSIEHRVEPIPDRPHERTLIFEVSEGERVAVVDVEFEGNNAFTDEELEAQLATREEGFFWFRSGSFDDEQLRSDMRDRLPAFYRRHGYIDFAVGGDSLVVDPMTGKARLIIRVNEGPQYRLASFDVRGNRRFAAEDLRRYFEERRSGLLGGFGLGAADRVQTGDVFDAVAFDEATRAIESLYRNEGYLYIQVGQLVERVPAEGDGPPEVRVAWQIQEYQPAYINRVIITGNLKTHEDVIRDQILVVPGDVYNEDLLIQSYQRISSLGFFEAPLPEPKIEPVNGIGPNVDIIFEVRERQTGSINFGTALGGATGVAGFLGYDEPNLFGQAKQGHLRWEFGRYSNNFEASYADPSILGSRYSGSLSLFSSRDRFFTFSEGQRRRTGAALRFGLPLFADRYTRFSVGYSLSRTTYEEFDEGEAESLFSLPPGVQSTVTFGVVRSALDHPFFPTVGSRQSLTADLTGGILGGDGTFQKYLFEGAWYVPVGQLGESTGGGSPIRMTLGLTAEAGAIFGDASRFPFDRFWMGGVQFGRPLRGYDETTVTPFGYIDRDAQDAPLSRRFGDAFVRLSAEYAIRLNNNISLSAFYDAGNVWRRPSEMNPTRLLRGAGLGLTLVTPFGPLGLDYAYGFDKTDPGWQLHFKFGQGF